MYVYIYIYTHTYTYMYDKQKVQFYASGSAATQDTLDVRNLLGLLRLGWLNMA